MARRSLSKLESKLILALEWDGRRLISLKEIPRRLRCSPGHARKIAHTLIKKGWFEPIERGHYLLIGANRGPKGIPEMNPYLATRFFPQPYFFAHRFALTHHGLIAQVPSVIHVSVTRRKQPIEIKNVRFEFVILAKEKFFGFEEATAFGEKIYVSDLERTLLDSLDRTDLIGGIEVSAQAIFQARNRISSSKLISYFKKINNGALARRFGYLTEILKVKLNHRLIRFLKEYDMRNPAFLGAPSRWGVNGPRDGTWNLIVNVPQRELMGEIRTI